MDRPLEGALEGQRVVVTRASGQAAEFSAALRAAGAEVLEYPVIDLAPPVSWAPVDEAIARLESYHWIVFTSANAVSAFAARVDLERLRRAAICAVGPATRRAVEALSLPVALVPDEYVGEGVVAALTAAGVAGRRVLIPRAAVARDVVPDGLRAAGATVDVVEVYRNLLPPSPGPFPEAVDWVTFTSASTVKNLLVLVERERLAGVKTASIGPQTSAALRMHGLPVTVEAAASTTADLLEAMACAFPLTDVLDLHAFAPRDVGEAVEAFLESAREQGLVALRIIHGRGIGAQRERVRSILASKEFVESFGDAPLEAGGWGATLVTLRRG